MEMRDTSVYAVLLQSLIHFTAEPEHGGQFKHFSFLFFFFKPDLSISYHGARHLLSSSDLAGAEGAFGGEVETQAVGGDQGASLVGLPQDSSQGEVEDVRGRVVAHDESATSLKGDLKPF